MIQVAKWLWENTAKLGLIGFCLMILVAGCQPADEKVADAKGKVQDAREDVAVAQQDLKEASREARAEWQADWLAFKTDINKKVADNERRILELRSEVARLDVRYQSEYSTNLDEVERRNNELRERVNNSTDEGDARWEAFKTDVGRDFDNLKTSIENIKIRSY